MRRLHGIEIEDQPWCPATIRDAATDYLQLFGFVTLGYMWARMAKVALDRIAAGGETPYLKTKLVTGRFFMERMLPETALHLARIQSGAATTMELAADAF